MTTPQKILRPLIQLQILRHKPKPVNIEIIYSFLNSALDWDSDDLNPPKLNEEKVSYPSWKRNVRNVLLQDTKKGLIKNTKKRSGNYVWGKDTPIPWPLRIVQSFDRLGNELRLEDIYSDIERFPHRELPKSWKAIIRGRIEQYSSDSDAYSGAVDLFYSVSGKGQGVWGLRSNFHNTSDNLVLGDRSGRLGIEKEKSNYDSFNDSTSLPLSPIAALPPPSFQNSRPKAIPSHDSDSKSSKPQKSGPRKPERGLVYIRAIYSVNNQENIQLGSAFKHGFFGIGNEEKRRSSGYTDLPPFDENSIWLASEFVAIAGPFNDVVLAEKEFSNQLVSTWNIQIGLGNQKEWHPYQSSTNKERVKELGDIVSELSSFAKEKGVEFEFRPTYYSLCG